MRGASTMRTCFFFCALMCIGQSYIWETRDYFQRRFQYVPTVRETAKKLMNNFLDRNSRLLKREVRTHMPFDTVLIVDASKSLTEQDFKRGLHAMKELIRRSRPDSKFAGISFSNDANITFPFVSSKQAIKGVDKMKYIGGKTNTQAALNKARRKLLFNLRSGLRMASFKRIFLLTDGQSNVKQWATLYKALLIKMLGVEIFVMAVGDEITGINELVSIASSNEAHLFRVRNMTEFEKVVRIIPLTQPNDGYGLDSAGGILSASQRSYNILE